MRVRFILFSTLVYGTALIKVEVAMSDSKGRRVENGQRLKVNKESRSPRYKGDMWKIKVNACVWW